MSRLNLSSLVLLTLAVGNVDCGGRSGLGLSIGASDESGGAASDSTDGGGGFGPVGGSTTFAIGGSVRSAGGSSIGGTAPTFAGGATSVGGASPAAGGATSGVGGAFDLDIEGSFYFLGSAWELPNGYTFATWPSTLSRFVPGEFPWHFFSYSVDITIPFAHPPSENTSTFLLGVSSWAEGENQYLQSYKAYETDYVNHGLWGRSPLGVIDTYVDAAFKFSDDVLVVLNWNATLNQSEIRLVNDADALLQDQPQDKLKQEFGKLIYEASGVRLEYHGLTSLGEALFSDETALLFLNNLGEMSIIEGLDERLSVAARSPYSDGLIARVETSAENTEGLRLYEDGWSEINLEEDIVPGSVTWGDKEYIYYESAGDVYYWPPYGSDDGSFIEPQLLSDLWLDFRPRGGSVSGDFGTAFRVESTERWAVAFIRGETLSSCKHSTTKIGALEPHVRDGVAGVLFDEVSPDSEQLFGRIYFCAPGQDAIDLLSEHKLYGRLLSR